MDLGYNLSKTHQYRRIPIDLRINSKFSTKLTRGETIAIIGFRVERYERVNSTRPLSILTINPTPFSPLPLSLPPSFPPPFTTTYIYIYSSISDERAQWIVSQRTKQYNKRRERIPRRYWMRDARDLIRVANGRDICALIVFWLDDLAPFAC